MRDYPSVGIRVGDILVPNQKCDMAKWAVVACDQFTSEPEYWDEVAKMVGDAPSTYHLILPEVFLGSDEETARLHTTQQNMKRYQEDNDFDVVDHLILVERTFGEKIRHGLMIALDLEKYDYNKGSTSLIRATEGTILDRLPPRIKIREGATLEFPHILVLIDDPEGLVIEPLVKAKQDLKPLYDFDLMLDSGHLRGYAVDNDALEQGVVAGLEALSSPEQFEQKYIVDRDKGVLLYAMGDGNHSLATAKAIWEKNKHLVGMDHPSRYALVELENVHDAGLEFEPIHRVLFNVKEDILKALGTYFDGHVEVVFFSDAPTMEHRVLHPGIGEQLVGLITPEHFAVIKFEKPTSNLAVGTLQGFLDHWHENGGFEKIDYVHGDEATVRLGSQPGNAGLLLPPMAKGELFRTVILDGALPRKTFSMGEAKEKRFYFEGRKIV